MSSKQDINIGQFTDFFQVPEGISKDEAWCKLQRRIELYKNISKPKKRRQIIPYLTVISIASAAVFLYFILHTGFDSTPKYSNEKLTQFGEVQSYWLPDSSRVELNSNSTIRYSYDKITKHRNVMLKGDALFTVKKGDDFIVAFLGGEVKVKGTAFYVSAYSPNLIQVDCIHGAVDVILNNQIISLTKGWGIKCFKGKVSDKYSCNENDVRKRLDGVFYWEKVSLAELDELAEYRFGYNILLESGLENRNFSGELDFTDLQGTLTIISMAMDVDYSINEERKTITINAK